VGVLKNAKFLLTRLALETLYKSFILPIIEYGDIVWSNIPDYLNQRIEKVHIDALRVITGLTVSCSCNNIYREIGFAPMSVRRKYLCLLMYYKIINDMAPDYLVDLLPTLNRERTHYSLRNTDDTLFQTRKVLNSTSFFPNTTRLWNQLPGNIRNKGCSLHLHLGPVVQSTVST
jgi:hypothetical protein